MINRGDQEGYTAQPFPSRFVHTCVDNPREVCPACADSEEKDYELEQSRR